MPKARKNGNLIKITTSTNLSYKIILYGTIILVKIKSHFFLYAVAQLIEALCYKPEVRGFNSQCVFFFTFFVHLILPAALWPWVRLSL